MKNDNNTDALTLPKKVSLTTSLIADSTTQSYVHAAISENTRRAYRSAIKRFIAWGGQLPCQPNHVMAYVVSFAEQLNPRTLDVHLAALRQWHIQQLYPDPTNDPRLIKVMVGVRRLHGQPKKKAKALRPDDIVAILDEIRSDERNNETKAIRDTALLLVAFFGAFRPSELVNITADIIEWDPEGITIHLPRSKTDQSGKGISRSIPCAPTQCTVCAVRTLDRWLGYAGIGKTTTRPVFPGVNRWGKIKEAALTVGGFNLLAQNYAVRSGINDVTGYSFRRGLTTSAARSGADFEAIKKQGGWKSDVTVREYIDEGVRYRDSATHVLFYEFMDRQ